MHIHSLIEAPGIVMVLAIGSLLYIFTSLATIEVAIAVEVRIELRI